MRSHAVHAVRETQVSGFVTLGSGFATFATSCTGSTAGSLDPRIDIGAATVTLGNVGPGLGLVGPSTTYTGMGDGALRVMSALMLLGRLEIFTVIQLFTRGYWR